MLGLLAAASWFWPELRVKRATTKHDPTRHFCIPLLLRFARPSAFFPMAGRSAV